jgi:hypothetical protein
MIAHLIDNLRAAGLRLSDPDLAARTRAAARAAHAEWRFERDIGAVMAALDRLSDRRLALIGMRRDALFEAVAEMITRAEVDRQAAAETLSLAEGRRPDWAREAEAEAAFPAAKAGRAA